MPHIPKKISEFISAQVAVLMVPVIGRSRMVRMTKIALVVLALLITAILIILPVSGSINKNFRLTFSSVEPTEESALPKMINPHLQGVDSGGQEYNISAKSAVQDKRDTMILKEITGDISLKNNGWVSITANEGFFNHTLNTLDLRGNINVFSDNGYEFATSEAYADIKRGTLYGNEAITGQGPVGHIRADSFYVEGNGKCLLLRGHVKLVLFPDTVKQ